MLDWLLNIVALQAHCQAEAKSGKGTGYLKRAKTENLREIFHKYASVEKNGEHYMTAADFVRNYLGLYTEPNFNPNSITLLGGILDTSKDGLISFAEFHAFEGLLCVPDALYKTAFQLFDTKGTGMVSFDEFVEVIKQTILHQKVPFDFDSEFVKMYFGKERKRVISYAEFCQFLHVSYLVRVSE
ncbi:calcium-binding mitochondrial carrier protein Aralar1-like isoform X2 [Procambarus clarkii]